MAVQMNEIRCDRYDCKFRDGCIVCNSVEKGARFSPVLKLKLESLVWKLKCFSYVNKKGEENGRERERIFPV